MLKDLIWKDRRACSVCYVKFSAHCLILFCHKLRAKFKTSDKAEIYVNLVGDFMQDGIAKTWWFLHLLPTDMNAIHLIEWPNILNF